MVGVEYLKFKFNNEKPVISVFLEQIKEMKDATLSLKKLEIYGGKSLEYKFDQN